MVHYKPHILSLYFTILLPHTYYLASISEATPQLLVLSSAKFGGDLRTRLHIPITKSVPYFAVEKHLIMSQFYA